MVQSIESSDTIARGLHRRVIFLVTEGQSPLPFIFFATVDTFLESKITSSAM